MFHFPKCFNVFIGHLPQSPQMTTADPQDSNGATPNSLNGNEGRITSGYSINGILGIQHANDVNVNSMKRKRVDDHGKSKVYKFFSQIHRYRAKSHSIINMCMI